MREMKYSGVEWIGEIPENWNVMPIKSLFDFGKGLPITKENLVDVGIPVISYGQIHSKINSGTTTHEELIRYVDESYLISNSESLVEKGDFIFADTSEDREGCGNCAAIDVNYKIFGGYHTILLKANMPQTSRYLSYLFKTDHWRTQIRSKVTGVKLFSISRKILGATTIILPPQSEQDKIADYLDMQVAKVDTLIRNQEKQIENLKAYKQSLITETVTKGLDPSTPMKDSGVEWVKKIPAHWNVIYPKALFKLRKEKARIDDKQLTSSQQYGILFQDEYMEKTGTRIVVVEKDFSILKHVEKGDFVISMRSFQGGLEYSENTGCISSAYVMLIPDENKIFAPFYKWFFKSDIYINALQSTSNLVRDGQAMRYSNFVQIQLFDIPYDEQVEISNYLEPKCRQIDKLISIKQSKIEKLNEYKKSLIYEYVTGKKEI